MYLQAKFYYLQTNAHRMVTLALYHGDLIRPDTCGKCGKASILLDSHHEDYSRPLEIIWLCRSCHSVLHGHRGGNARKARSNPKLRQAMEYLINHQEDLYTSSRELESKFTGISYGTIHKAQQIIRSEKEGK